MGSSTQSSPLELCLVLKPLIVSMNLLGFLFNGRPDEAPASPGAQRSGDNETSTNSSASKRRRHLAHKIYCLSVCGFLWFRTLSLFPSFWVGVDFYPGMVSRRVVFFTWLLQCSLNATITVYGSIKDNALNSFLELWRTLKIKEKCEMQSEDEDCLSEEGTGYTDIAFSYCDSSEIRKRIATASAYGPARLTDVHPKEDSRKSVCSESLSTVVEENISFCDGDDSLELPLQAKSNSNPCQETTTNTGSELNKASLTPVEESKNGILLKDGDKKENKHEQVLELDTKSDVKNPSPKEFSWCHPFSRLNKYEKIGIGFNVVAWALILTNQVITGYIYFDSTLRDVEEISVAMTNPFGTSLPMKIVTFTFQFLDSCAWILPAMYCCALCAVLRTRFNHVTDTITTKLSQTRDRFPTSLERWRQEHLRLCQCVTAFDRVMGKMLLASYATNLPLAVLLLYVLVARDFSLGTNIVFGFWLVAGVANMMIMSLVAASVHEAAHSPLERLFFVRADHACPIQLAQLHLFLTKLSGSSIGFSALGIIVTREMALTLVGLLVSYFVVLLPFQIS